MRSRPNLVGNHHHRRVRMLLHPFFPRRKINANPGEFSSFQRAFKSFAYERIPVAAGLEVLSVPSPVLQSTRTDIQNRVDHRSVKRGAAVTRFADVDDDGFAIEIIIHRMEIGHQTPRIGPGFSTQNHAEHGVIRAHELSFGWWNKGRIVQRQIKRSDFSPTKFRKLRHGELIDHSRFLRRQRSRIELGATQNHEAKQK